MMVFLGILTVGFIYEWKKGALDWEKNNINNQNQIPDEFKQIAKDFSDNGFVTTSIIIL